MQSSLLRWSTYALCKQIHSIISISHVELRWWQYLYISALLQSWSVHCGKLETISSKDNLDIDLFSDGIYGSKLILTESEVLEVSVVNLDLLYFIRNINGMSSANILFKGAREIFGYFIISRCALLTPLIAGNGHRRIAAITSCQLPEAFAEGSSLIDAVDFAFLCFTYNLSWDNPGLHKSHSH